MSSKARDGERDQRRVGGRGRAEVEAAALERGERVELALGGGQPVEDRVGVADQHLARLGEADAAGGALDEPGAGLGLERGDLARDRGLGEVERFGGGGEGAVRGDLAQDPQASDIEHVRKRIPIRHKDHLRLYLGRSRMLAMHPHPALSQALITEFNGERTRMGPPPLPQAQRLPLARRPVPPGGARSHHGLRLGA